jgi:hypothetical protein
VLLLPLLLLLLFPAQILFFLLPLELVDDVELEVRWDWAASEKVVDVAAVVGVVVEVAEGDIEEVVGFSEVEEISFRFERRFERVMAPGLGVGCRGVVMAGT